jgi:hypothetical protein
VTGAGSSDRDERRLCELEEFVEDVADMADTLELLGAEWGGEIGAAVITYARQIGARAERMRTQD